MKICCAEEQSVACAIRGEMSFEILLILQVWLHFPGSPAPRLLQFGIGDNWGSRSCAHCGMYPKRLVRVTLWSFSQSAWTIYLRFPLLRSSWRGKKNSGNNGPLQLAYVRNLHMIPRNLNVIYRYIKQWPLHQLIRQCLSQLDHQHSSRLC